MNFDMTEQEIITQRDQFMERVLGSVRGTFDIFAMYLGEELGFYRVLATGGALTSTELATRTNTHERYVREWMEQQTVTGILHVEDETLDAKARKYRLPAAYVEPLTDHDSLNYLAPLTRLIAGAVRPMPALLEAYRKGGGVPYSAYGSDLHQGQAEVNRPAFLKQLAQEWIPAMPDVHARLQASPPAMIADFGCGHGWSTIGMARGYPKTMVDGFDLDTASIEHARQNVREAGLQDRVQFHIRDAGDAQFAGQYDLVTAFECVHDMSNPIAALSVMKRLAGKTGTVLIVDERVADTFSAQANEVEGVMYGWSILHCLPVGMADQPSAETGTVMRLETLECYAKEAGFSRVEVLPIENYFFRFYRLHQD